MSSYSSLCFAANTDVRPPNPTRITELLIEHQIIAPSRQVNDIGNLSDDLSNFFILHSGREKNESLFAPDSVAFRNQIEVLDPEGEFWGDGWVITIHGNGYFFPLTHKELSAFLNIPRIQKFSEAVAEQFGGNFTWPTDEARAVLDDTLIKKVAGWCWFGSQSI